MPVGAPTFAEGLRWGAEVFHALKGVLHGAGLNTSVGDEGGYAPSLPVEPGRARRGRRGDREGGLPAGRGHRDRAGPGGDGVLRGRNYVLAGEGTTPVASEIVDYWADAVAQLPDRVDRGRLAEDDWATWAAMTARMGSTVQLVGDDLYVTNTERLQRGHRRAPGKRDPGQAEPDRDADRETLDAIDWPAATASTPSSRTAAARRTTPSSRTCGRDERRPDQDRRPPADRSRGEVQPAPPGSRRDLGGSASTLGGRSSAGSAPRRPDQRLRAREGLLQSGAERWGRGGGGEVIAGGWGAEEVEDSGGERGEDVPRRELAVAEDAVGGLTRTQGTGLVCGRSSGRPWRGRSSPRRCRGRR
jgi:hypothetical protein